MAEPGEIRRQKELKKGETRMVEEKKATTTKIE